MCNKVYGYILDQWLDWQNINNIICFVHNVEIKVFMSCSIDEKLQYWDIEDFWYKWDRKAMNIIWKDIELYKIIWLNVVMENFHS